MPDCPDDEASVTQVSALGLLWNCISHVQGSEQIHGLGGPWECVESPAGTSQGPHDIPASLPETNDFRPPEPDEREKDVYGIIHATGKAHAPWLILAANAICFGEDPKAAQAYRDWARSYMLLPKLERQALICDIEVRYSFESIDPSNTSVDISYSSARKVVAKRRLIVAQPGRSPLQKHPNLPGERPRVVSYKVGACITHSIVAQEAER